MFDRYNCEYCNIIGENDMCEAKDGDWVKYEDVKHLLERSDNKDYVPPKAKSCLNCRNRGVTTRSLACSQCVKLSLWQSA